MVSLTSLWLPILLSAVVVFIASSIVHMVLKYHHNDYGQLPAEAEVADALRKFNIPPGDYMLPRPAGPSDMNNPEFKARWERGPRMLMTVWAGGSLGMGPQLAQWFVFCVVVSLFAGYLASRALPPGAAYLDVSQIASTTAFLGYVMANWPGVIWYRRSVRATLLTTMDGLVYGLLTGGVFGWLWPQS